MTGALGALVAPHGAVSVAADSPEPSSELSPEIIAALNSTMGADLMMLVVFVLGLIAMAAIGKVIAARRETRKVARLARKRARSMAELLRTVRMAETIAGIGVWQYDPKSGNQQWSDGLKRLFGIDAKESFVEGDAETLLFANDIDLISKVKDHAEEVEPFMLQFDVYGYDGVAHSISVQACNLMGGDGTVHRVVAVVRDNTVQVQRERLLETKRAEAIDEARHARELAETDPLTGLANRRRVMRELDRIVMNARVTQMPLVMVMFDIDHFKRVNDTHGHPLGDKVLQRVARLANGQARQGDTVGRVGGEEFVWIIPGASDGMARVMIERLRQIIASDSGVEPVSSVTVSLGYTCIQAGDTALSLFARADGALYDAKHAGRNRVRMAA
ncbi:GGDEF domain-containing protein [Erythrobacter sp. Alg231-14]|uniref:GGDEF domain-containing protein n=1 Tax=Erythrobacter sp. Alg231-14 TaxID=1922225 RepID=UPI00307C78D7